VKGLYLKNNKKKGGFMFKSINLWSNLSEWVTSKAGLIKTASQSGDKDRVFVIASMLSERCGLDINNIDLQELNKHLRKKLGTIEKVSDLKLTETIAYWLDEKKLVQATSQLRKMVSDAIKTNGPSKLGPVEFAVKDGIRLQAHNLTEAKKSLERFQKYMNDFRYSYGRPTKVEAGPSIKIEREAKIEKKADVGRGSVNLPESTNIKKQDIDKCRQCVFYNSDPGATHLNKCLSCLFYGLGGTMNLFVPRSTQQFHTQEFYPGYGPVDVPFMSEGLKRASRKLGMGKTAEEKLTSKEVKKADYNVQVHHVDTKEDFKTFDEALQFADNVAQQGGAAAVVVEEQSSGNVVSVKNPGLETDVTPVDVSTVPQNMI
jgi:hypothetical protein